MIDFIVDTLKKLITIDTRTTQNNETQAAYYIKDICSRYGIWAEVIEPISGKGSIVAYLPGRDFAKENILLLSHLDTAEFGNLSKWIIKPTSGIEYENKVFGRGAIDCKGLVSLWLSILVYYKINNMRPERGIVFAAVADEENGGTYGSKFLLDAHKLMKASKYVISEGGGFPIKIGKKIYYTCQNSEKGETTYLVRESWLKEFVDSVDYHGVQTLSLFRGIVSSKLYDMNLVDFLLKQSLNRNTSRKINIKEVLLDSVSFNETADGCQVMIRHLPHTSRKYIENTIRKKYSIQLSNAPVLNHVEATYTSVNTDIFRIIKREVEMQLSDTMLIPYMTPGYSDNRYFRAAGKIVYGFFPLAIKDRIAGIHGYNEYISIESLQIAFDLMKKIVWKISTLDNVVDQRNKA